jgi:hypothetical protein
MISLQKRLIYKGSMSAPKVIASVLPDPYEAFKALDINLKLEGSVSFDGCTRHRGPRVVSTIRH